MIEETTLLWVGTVALVTTFGGIYVSVQRYRQNESSLMGLIAYGFALMMWILFTLHSTQYVRQLGSGVTATAETPSFMVVGIIGSILTMILLFEGAFKAIQS